MKMSEVNDINKTRRNWLKTSVLGMGYVVVPSIVAGSAASFSVAQAAELTSPALAEQDIKIRWKPYDAPGVQRIARARDAIDVV